MKDRAVTAPSAVMRLGAARVSPPEPQVNGRARRWSLGGVVASAQDLVDVRRRRPKEAGTTMSVFASRAKANEALKGLDPDERLRVLREKVGLPPEGVAVTESADSSRLGTIEIKAD